MPDRNTKEPTANALVGLANADAGRHRATAMDSSMNSILIVDDNPPLIALLGKMLEPVGRITFATSGRAALAQMRKSAPDLVLLDAEMPEMNGHEVCEVMKADQDLSKIPVVFVTAHNDVEAEVRGFAAGAVDFISKPVNEDILLARVQTQLRLKHMADELRRSASVDGLTCLANRASFDQRLALEISRAARGAGPVSLVVLDVDHFKKYNDRYGHPAGDKCLRAVASAIDAQARRPADVAARIGGEEFALLLPETESAGAGEAAERIRAAIARLDIAHADSPTAPAVTVSVGVATCWPRPPVEPSAATDLIERADRALYEAKSRGRNGVVIAPALPHRASHELTPVLEAGG